MKHCLRVLLVLICSIKAFSQNDTIPKQKDAESVSIISIIANPDKYSGKRVSISGYMSSEFEGTAIYLSREDFDNKIYKNSIFLLIGKGDGYHYYHKQYVTLEGTFIKGGGHFGMFSGELKGVDNIYIIRRRN